MNRSETSDKCVLVYDNGLFLPLALKLSESFGRTLYYSPWENSYPVLNDCVIGDGFENVERVDDIFEHLDEFDLVVFPDVRNSGLQKHLESIGKRVWGSRECDDLELKRMLLKKKQEQMALNVPKYKSIIGLDELRAFLKDHEDLFIKISQYRGVMETFHHLDYAHSQPILDHLSVLLGPLQNEFPFLVEWPIPDALELGFDGYSVDGNFPSIAIQGWEKKDKGLIASVQKYEDLPKQVLEVNEAFSLLLEKHKYRNFFSTEIRVRDDEGYLIDLTCRAGCPSIESQLQLWKNLSEIIWHGAVGEMVDPEPAGKFAVECMISHQDDKSRWRLLEVPDEIEDNIKPYYCCRLSDGLLAFPPLAFSSETVGSIVCIGDTLESAIDELKEKAQLLEGQPINVQIDSIYDMLKTIHQAEEQGIEFSSQETPEPEIAL